MRGSPKRSYVLSVKAGRLDTSFALRAASDGDAVRKALRLVDHLGVAHESPDYELRRPDGRRLRPIDAMPWAEAAE